MNFYFLKSIKTSVKYIFSVFNRDTLAREILEEQVTNEWPGLAKDAVEICENLGVDGLLDNDVSKRSFKRTIKTALRRKNDEELNDELKKYKKMEIL